ncbi:hypothetical protein JZ751_003128 [Albula glossodonta]|uniref:Ig-like domain-containing protein n=1 Tax=Albula glossodonta TaxID=121402 RepID=A0A8T2NBS6_9TELE|nr:hypothetical protein JZ751_003128 [Albula glossodonta]
MMIKLLIPFSVSLSCLTVQVEAMNIQVVPASHLVKDAGQSSTFSCSCDDQSYVRMYWYQQPGGKGVLKLIGLLYRDNLTPGDQFSDRFQISGDATTTGTLEISNLMAGDSAVYFCAMSKAHRYRSQPLHFRNLSPRHRLPYSLQHTCTPSNVVLIEFNL